MALAGVEKSKTFLFFALSQIFVFLSLYALYDEAVVRRPWKNFQTEFNRLEMQLAQREYAGVFEQYVKEGLPKITKLKKELEEAEIARESDAYQGLKDKRDGLQIKFDDKEQQIKFNKSVLDAYYYEWKHAYAAGHDYQSAQKRHEGLEQKIEGQKKELSQIRGELKTHEQQIDVYDDRIQSLQEKIAALEKSLNDAQKKVDGVHMRISEIRQVIVEDLGIQGNIYWGKVDRCQTCHINADKAGYENVAEAFDLAVVKDNQAVREAFKKDPQKKGFLITPEQKEHYQIMYGTHPRRDELLTRHPVEKFGCTSCHGGDGRALRIRGLAFAGDEGKTVENSGHAENTGSSSGYVHGVFGEKDYAHATHHHGVEPLLRGTQMESNCLTCHNGQILIPEAKQLTRGLNLFVDLGCHGCHLVKGYDELFKVGPELNKVAAKVDKIWLVDWLKNPKNYMPNSRMPMFRLSDEEAAAVASYLLANSQDHALTHHLNLVGNQERGKQVFESVGCLGCHSADDSEQSYAKRSRAPNLSRVSAKLVSSEWLYDWLKNPKGYSQHARMPNLRLADAEAADLTAYLIGLNEGYTKHIRDRSQKIAALVNPADEEQQKYGKKIITKRGCYGCHDIRGFEKVERIGPELTAVALKETFELDFGDALKKDFVFTDEFGKKVYVTHNPEKRGARASDLVKGIDPPVGANAVTNLEETWQSWVRNKLRYPLSIYFHERVESNMPNFDLSHDELDALGAFLKAMQKREIPLRFQAASFGDMTKIIAGQRLVSKYNCLGCHTVRGYGGDILAHIDERMGSKLTQFYPPSLDHVGEKVRPEWLFDFLQGPEVYRPQLTVRMPTFDFSDDEINTLIGFFAGMNGVETTLSDLRHEVSHKNIEVAKVLAGPEAYNCFSCHFNQGKAPSDDPANWAPDWTGMKERLQHDFIIKWIKNPAKYQEFAVMPGFLNSDDEAHPDYLDGKAEKQLEALRDFILSVGDGGSK